MEYRTIQVKKINPRIGAEIWGIDLSKPLLPLQLREIEDAWMQHLVIVFRGQQLTVENHMAFARHFGDLHIHPAALQAERHPEILVVQADENSTRIAGEEWHSDVSCEAEPPLGSLLYITTVPPDGGGDTLFADMYGAYDTLPQRIKDLIGGLTAIHDSQHVFNGELYRENRQHPRAEHPMVRTHPVTKRPLLYVNRYFTTRIVGMSRSQSDAILEMLFRHIETPEFSMRLRWTPHTLACWDNRCTQHRALFDYHPHRRYGERVTVKGDAPFYVAA
jgi:taurine dioxygenase